MSEWRVEGGGYRDSVTYGVKCAFAECAHIKNLHQT